MRGQVVVVGAGIVGLSIALRLRLQGWNVRLIESAPRPGAGASSAALGSLTPYSDHGCTPETRRLAEASVAMYPDWLAELGALSGESIDYDAPGLLEVAISEAEEASLRSAFASLTASGAPVDWLSADEARELEPSLASDTHGAILYRTEAIVDVTQLLAACERAARRLGCIIVVNARVTRILSEEGIVIGVETPLGVIRGDRVVLAPGTELSRIEDAPMVHLDRIRGEVVEVRGAPGLIGRHLYCGDGFMTPRRDGRIFLGSNYDIHIDGEDECSTTASVRSIVRTLLATTRIVPSISSLQVQRSWKGWRPRTPDGQPVIGWSAQQGLCLAIGFFGLGITLAPITAEIVGRLLADETPHEIASLGVDRFQSF